MLADNYDEFLKKAFHALQTALNSEAGQALTQELLKRSLEENPNLTAEEWAKRKQDFMAFCFSEAMKESPELMAEFEAHVCDEIRKLDKEKETIKHEMGV